MRGKFLGWNHCRQIINLLSFSWNTFATDWVINSMNKIIASNKFDLVNYDGACRKMERTSRLSSRFFCCILSIYDALWMRTVNCLSVLFLLFHRLMDIKSIKFKEQLDKYQSTFVHLLLLIVVIKRRKLGQFFELTCDNGDTKIK